MTIGRKAYRLSLAIKHVPAARNTMMDINTTAASSTFSFTFSSWISTTIYYPRRQEHGVASSVRVADDEGMFGGFFFSQSLLSNQLGS
uniref:Uncharacterized protein n=1 Tax=Triticum urartu TaxID=4572 RepID=A0A8R7R3R0_TRIUA